MTIYESLMKEIDYLNTLIKNATSFLSTAANGSLKITHSQKKYINYHLYPSNKYLSLKKEKPLIQNLAQKSYEKKILKTAMKQKACIEKFLAIYNPHSISDVARKYDTMDRDLINYHEDFCKSMPDSSSENGESKPGVDLARNLITICEAFLQSKGSSL